MFWKVIGGIALFFMVVVLALGLVAATGVAVAGAAVGSVIENIDTSTVQVTDENGNTETYTLGELINESGRVEIIGDNGERVTIEMPQVTLQEQGQHGGRVVIGESSVTLDESGVVIGGQSGIVIDESGLVIGGESGLVIDGETSQVRIDGREIDHYNNHDNFEFAFIGRLIGGLFSAMFKLAFWGLVVFVAVMLLRKRQPVAAEKAPPAE